MKLVPVALLTMIAISLVPALGQAAQQNFDLTAHESGCPAPKTFCFTPVSLPTVAPGDTVSMTLTNPSGNGPHNICAQVGSTKTCAPGENQYINANQTTTLNFSVPASGVTSVSYWCNVPGHQQLGMQGTLTVQSALPAGGSTGGSTGGSSSGTSGGSAKSPGVGVFAVLVGVGLLALALRRR